MPGPRQEACPNLAFAPAKGAQGSRACVRRVRQLTSAHEAMPDDSDSQRGPPRSEDPFHPDNPGLEEVRAPSGPAAAGRGAGRLRSAGLIAPVLVLLLYLGTSASFAGPESKPVVAPAPVLDPIPARFNRREALQPGERLEPLLTRTGLSPNEVVHLADLVRPYADPADPPPGTVVRWEEIAGAAPEQVALRLDLDRILRFDVVGARWAVRLDSTLVRLDTVVVAGGVGANLYSATLSGDVSRLGVEEKADLVAHLSQVYAWQIDFYRDVKPGDAFRLAIERAVRTDGSVRASRVLAAEYMNDGHLRTAFRFRPAGESETFFYDEKGRALRSAFLRAPLDFVRVTSRFDLGRFHPLLGGYQAHRGVDYGAASGTPVRATGAGVIVRAGWWGDYGLVIEVAHGNGIQTRYAHLGGIEKGVARGASVAQGQKIGRVGSTGLATGSHLHYEFLLRDIHTDPTRVDLPVERPIPDEDRERFATTRAVGWLLLSRTSWPGGLWQVRDAGPGSTEAIRSTRPAGRIQERNSPRAASASVQGQHPPDPGEPLRPR